jgi:hypothetical protein
MADPIDPRLFSSSLQPQAQTYTAGPQQQQQQQSAGHHPYYHAAIQQPSRLSLSHASPLDPALNQTSPTGPQASQDEEDEHEDDGEDHDVHATPGSAKSPGDIKRPRACDSCRGLKVRCDQDRPDISCKRCAKAGRPWCVYLQPILSPYSRELTMVSITTPPTRKRQKKADSRVAELERKIDALTATLHSQKAGTPETRHHGGIPIHEGNTPIHAMPEGSFRMGTLSHEWGNNSAPSRYPDIPPGYGPASQAFPRGPEAKRRKLDGNTHAVCLCKFYHPAMLTRRRPFPRPWMTSIAT